jgi:arsenate reductase-like glutaredoxin family protein
MMLGLPFLTKLTNYKEMNNETITISKIEYEELKTNKQVLEAFLKSTENTCEECRKRERKIYDNLPYEDIEQFVEEDLRRFGQDNPAPLSMTVLFERDGHKMFRHYELGCIIGYVLFGYIPEDEKHSISPRISVIEEDDENWFAPNTPMYMAASWMNNSRKTLDRMHKWYHEHIDEGFRDGKWHEGFIKDIVPEEIYEDNGMSSCELFAGPDDE